MVNLHAFFSLTLNNLSDCSNQQLAEIANYCQQLKRAIEKNRK